MRSARFKRKDSHVLRLEKDRDLLQQLTDYCNEHGIDAAHVSVIGAVTEANVGFYDQDTEEYEERFIDEPMEIIQATGNVSFLDGGRFVHMHATFCEEDGTVQAGHLFNGTVVFAGEAILHELDGPRLERGDDPQTGLTLWDL